MAESAAVTTLVTVFACSMAAGGPLSTGPASRSWLSIAHSAEDNPPMLWPTSTAGGPVDGGTRPVGSGADVRDEVVHPIDVAAPPARASVPAVIVGRHRVAACRERVGHVAVAAAVLADPVISPLGADAVGVRLRRYSSAPPTPAMAPSC